MFARRLAFLLGWIGLAVFAGLAVVSFDARRDPGSLDGPKVPGTGALQPPAGTLEAEADRCMRRALQILADREIETTERLERYDASLREAEVLLERSVSAQPGQAGALAKLAAVRWELYPTADPEAAERALDSIRLAARVAPAVPGVQMRLGKLLLEMGREDEALLRLRRAVELDASRADEAVALLVARFVSPDAILKGLSNHPRVVAELREPFELRGRLEDFLPVAEQALRRSPADVLLRAYGEAMNGSGKAERLIEVLDSLGTLEAPAAEVERIHQRALALLDVGRPGEAVEDARAARRLAPQSPRATEFLADVALEAELPAEAIGAYADALLLLARGSADRHARVRVYRKMGDAELDRGQIRNALDAYRLALALDPEDIVVLRRMKSLRGAPASDPVGGTRP